jgi:hypothetical protein
MSILDQVRIPPLVIRTTRAFSVPIESERRLYYFVLTRFLQREPVSTSLENALGPFGGPRASIGR